MHTMTEKKVYELQLILLLSIKKAHTKGDTEE